MRHLVKIFGILFGLSALLMCLNTPAQASPPETAGQAAHSRMTEDMPCCPDMPASPIKACAQHCPLLVAHPLAFQYVPQVEAVEFCMMSVRGSGLGYEPLAPPPR